MKKVGTLIFLLLLTMIGANILHSTESELVSIKAFVRNQKGKISEIKNFKKSKSLKVDGVKQQLSHFSIVLNEFTGSSAEDVRIQIYDADTIYYEKDLEIFKDNKIDIFFSMNSLKTRNKNIVLKITGFEEFEADILTEYPSGNNSNDNHKENLNVHFKTSFSYNSYYDTSIPNEYELSASEIRNKSQNIDDIEISGVINDIEIIAIEKGIEVLRKGPFCLSGSVFLKLYNPEAVYDRQRELNNNSDKKDLINLIIKQQNKIIYNGYSYFNE